MKQNIIVFDLDGTLVDTAPDLLDSLNHALLSGGVAEVDAVAHRAYVGFGGRVMIERAFLTQQRELAPERLQHLLDVFLSHYSAAIPGRSAPFPGAVEAIARFRDAGYLLAICTNKTERLAKSLMRGLGLESEFAAICGADTFDHRKPDPRHLFETIRLAGGDPARALMIGDSRTDIDTAKAAGIPVVAVDFGYTDRHVREFEPSKIISHFDEMTLALAERLIASAN